MPSEIKKWKLSIFGCSSVSGIGSTIHRVVLCVYTNLSILVLSLPKAPNNSSPDPS